MRECGACQLCCILPALPELGKPENTRCEHLTLRGCGIYDSPERPEVCQRFRCAWLNGLYGDTTTRPDRVGAYVTGIAPGDGLPGTMKGMTVRARPGYGHRFERYAAMRKLVRLQVDNGGDVLVAAGDERRVITKREGCQ